MPITVLVKDAVLREGSNVIIVGRNEYCVCVCARVVMISILYYVVINLISRDCELRPYSYFESCYSLLFFNISVYAFIFC